jgi:hypothetical protein
MACGGDADAALATLEAISGSDSMVRAEPGRRPPARTAAARLPCISSPGSSAPARLLHLSSNLSARQVPKELCPLEPFRELPVDTPSNSTYRAGRHPQQLYLPSRAELPLLLSACLPPSLPDDCDMTPGACAAVVQVPVEFCPIEPFPDAPVAPERNEHLSGVSPATVAPVAGATSGYTDRARMQMPLRDFSAHWRSPRTEPSLYYLKDWHMARQHPAAAASLYCSTPALGFDGLNAWCDAHKKDDFRFVYAGPAGSWTPLHHDVLYSCSWSANVAGRKKWILFPPFVTPLLCDGFGRLVPDARPGAWSGYGGEVAERLARAWECRVEAEQGAGDVIVVPPGWHHQVRLLLVS